MQRTLLSMRNIITPQRGRRSYVMVRSIILSVSRITHERVNGRRPNIQAWQRGDSVLKWLILVLIRIRTLIYDHFPTITHFNDTHQGAALQRPYHFIRQAFYTIYIQSPQDDTATALAEFALFRCSCYYYYYYYSCCCCLKNTHSNAQGGLWVHYRRASVQRPLLRVYTWWAISSRLFRRPSLSKT